MRIIGVDRLNAVPGSAPTPGRAQVWTDDSYGRSVIRLRFFGDDTQLVEHEIVMEGQTLSALPINRSTIAVLASHPNDIQSAIASYRVLGWSALGMTAPEAYVEHGYAICLFASNT
jgi:hypothetical protein